MSVIRGSFFGPPFCFASFAEDVENDLEVEEDVRRDEFGEELK